MDSDLVVPLSDDGEGSFGEKLRRIRQKYELDGWIFFRVIPSMTEGPQVLFTRPTFVHV
jgi:hypothetical protein